jgi:hypothetical protein
MAQPNAAKDRGVRANGNPLLDPGLLGVVDSITTAWKAIIRQRDVRTKEHIISDVDVLPNRYPILDCDVIAKRDV